MIGALKIVRPDFLDRGDGLIDVAVRVAFINGQAQAGGLQGIDIGAVVGVVRGVLPEGRDGVCEWVVFAFLDDFGVQDVFHCGHAGVDGDAFGAKDSDEFVSGWRGSRVANGDGPP